MVATEDEPMIDVEKRRIGVADFRSLEPASVRIVKHVTLVRRMNAPIAAENGTMRVRSSNPFFLPTGPYS